MAKRMVQTDFAASDGGTFTFELWDTASVSADNDYKIHLDAEGFSVDWKGSGGSYAPIISSTLKATMFLNEEQRGVIMPAIYDEDEFRVAVKILKDNNLWWVGIVHAEQCSEQIQDCIIAVEIGASDGLAMLENIDFKTDAGDRYTGFTSAQQVIWNCLKKIPCHSLWGTQLHAVAMYEWPLMKPVTATTTTFSYTGSDFTDRGVLDYLQIAPRTFYDTAPKERIKLYGNDFINKYKYSPDAFEPCKRVIEDILTSLGASICFANGSFHIWDYAGKIADTSSGLVNGVYYTVKADGDLEAVASSLNREVTVEKGMSEFKKGMTRKGVYAYRAASQTHINAGSDLIYTNGIPFNISRLAQIENGSNNEFSPYVHGPTMDFPDPSTGTYAGYFGYFDGDVQDLALSPLDGEVRIKFGGSAEYMKDTGANTSIARCRVEAYNGTNWYRLSRPIRTLYYTSSSTSGTPVTYQMSIDGGSPYYAPRYWSGAYEWIIDSDSKYGDAWLEVPMGSDSDVLESGTSLHVGQTDFPELNFFAPPCTKLSGDTDNTLEYTNENERAYFEWRHDVVYELDGIAGTVERMKINGFQQVQSDVWWRHNELYDIDGNLLDIGTHYFSGTANEYRTAEYAGDTNASGTGPLGLDVFRLNGVQLWIGDGDMEYDATYSFTPATPKGYEIAEMPNTRLGASFSHSGQARHSRYVTYVHDDLTTLQDRIKFISSFDTNEEDTMGQMACWQYMQARGCVRQQVSGSLFQVCGRTNSSIVYPYNRLITSKLNQGVEETFSVDSCGFTLSEATQKLELTKVTNASYITGTTAEDTDYNKGPSRPKRPSAGNMTLDRYISRKVADNTAVTDAFDLTGWSGQVSVLDIDTAVNKVQTTSPITDADLGGGGSGSDLITILLQRF